MPQITSARASGDGAMAFWTWSGLADADQLWCAPTDGRTPPRCLTDEADHLTIRDVNSDGSLVILAQSRHASEHDHLLLWRRDAGSLTQLTPQQQDHYLYGGTFIDGDKALIFLADFDYTTGEVCPDARIWRQDLTSGARQCLAVTPGFCEIAPKPSPNGATLLLHLQGDRAGAVKLALCPMAGAPPETVLNLGPDSAIHAEWLDNDTLTLVAGDGGRDGLALFHLASRRLEWLAHEPDLHPFAIVPGHPRPCCIVHDNSNTSAVTFDANGLTALPNTSGRGSLLPHDRLPDGGWLAEAYDAGAPHELVAVDAGGKVTRLATPAKDNARHHIRPPRFPLERAGRHGDAGLALPACHPVSGLCRLCPRRPHLAFRRLGQPAHRPSGAMRFHRAGPQLSRIHRIWP